MEKPIAATACSSSPPTSSLASPPHAAASGSPVSEASASPPAAAATTAAASTDNPVPSSAPITRPPDRLDPCASLCNLSEWPTNAVWDDVRASPHCLQVLHNEDRYRDLRYPDVPFQRVLDDKIAHEAYRRRRGEHKSVIHWGQRKLLLSEIEFLVHCLYGAGASERSVGKPAMLIYAGAAPGTHIRYLAELFPDVMFRLYDPAPFTVQESRNILTHQCLFTDELATELAALANDNDLYFVSDIRAVDWELVTDQETEVQVQRDMEAQMRWHEILQPRYSMLKFRLPWHPGQTTYLDGDIYLPIWGPITTTEARLITKGGRKVYDNTHYEQQMFFFNTRMRPALYPHPVSGEGIDHCYDCTAEIAVLRQLLTLSPEHSSRLQGADSVWRAISRMSFEISRSCSNERTLLSPNPDPAQRKQRIRERQYVNGAVPAYSVQAMEKPRLPDDSRKLFGGIRLGAPLGARGQGITEALSVAGNRLSRGLGYDAAAFMQQHQQRHHHDHQQDHHRQRHYQQQGHHQDQPNHRHPQASPRERRDESSRMRPRESEHDTDEDQRHHQDRRQDQRRDESSHKRRRAEYDHDADEEERRHKRARRFGTSSDSSSSLDP